MRKAAKKQGHDVKIYVSGSLTVAIFKEGRFFIAYAPALDIVGQGRNEAAAQKDFTEALELYFEETISSGTLEKDLRRYGWRNQAGSMQPPKLERFSSPEKLGKEMELTALTSLPLKEMNALCQV